MQYVLGKASKNCVVSWDAQCDISIELGFRL